MSITMSAAMKLTNADLEQVTGGKLTYSERFDLYEWEKLKNCRIKLCLCNASRKRLGWPILTKEYAESLKARRTPEDKPWSEKEAFDPMNDLFK